MMREIKFRAWDSKNKKMYSFELIELPYSENVNLDGQFDGLLDMYYKLMQYTGLKDKNGVEIFEGDLLKSYDEHGNIDVDKVIYNTSHCKFMLVSDSESRLPIGLGEYSSFTLEVIGNIHEVAP